MQLVILAAGLGSRFKGNKQTTAIDDDGNFIIDYSIFDAISAGFDSVVFIIRKENTDLTEQDVLDFCKGKIAWYKTPKYIAFVEEFPLNAAGKIMKYKLREIAHEMWPDA